MADYFLAPAGKTLWDWVRTRWPDRPAESDGWIGDSSHGARTSDHNPCWSCSGTSYGIVRAVDLDVDGWPATEVRDSILERCRSGAEKRLAYMINNRTIWSRTYNWVPRSYTGENPHLSHIHFSLVHDASNFDPAVWLPGHGGEGGGEPIDPPAPPEETEDDMQLKPIMVARAADPADTFVQVYMYAGDRLLHVTGGDSLNGLRSTSILDSAAAPRVCTIAQFDAAVAQFKEWGLGVSCPCSEVDCRLENQV